MTDAVKLALPVGLPMNTPAMSRTVHGQLHCQTKESFFLCGTAAVLKTNCKPQTG